MQKPDVLMMGLLPDWDMAPLEAGFSLHKFWEASDQADLLGRAGNRIRAVVTRGDLGLGRAVMDRLPQLEMISCFGVGTDAIDLAEARRRGIRVSNTPDVLTGDVADLAIALTLACARQLPAADQFVRHGQWISGPFPLATRVHGKRLGIVGLGRIGMATARRAEGFDMTIGYFGRSAQPDTSFAFHARLEDLAAASDFLICTLPGGAATSGLIGAQVFEALGPDGIFINVARGSVVDEAALLHALETRVIRGAGLDVFANEPAIDPRFFTLPNAVLQPHLGSGTTETRKAMGQLVRDNLAAHFAGRPLLTPVF
jgi:lactate dehydrogenase-like 2-hydroxyacid dehydrogenase